MNTPAPMYRVPLYPPRSAPRYDRVMSDLILTPVLTPVLAAALAENPRRKVVHKGRGGRKKSAHNFVAEGEKRKPGAPLGNRNAACRDAMVVERRARLASVQTVVNETLALAQAATAAADRDLKARQRLSALLLPGARS